MKAVRQDKCIAKTEISVKAINDMKPGKATDDSTEVETGPDGDLLNQLVMIRLRNLTTSLSE